MKDGDESIRNGNSKFNSDDGFGEDADSLLSGFTNAICIGAEISNECRRVVGDFPPLRRIGVGPHEGKVVLGRWRPSHREHHKLRKCSKTCSVV